MKGLNHLFAATALAGMGVLVSQGAVANDTPELEAGNCAPTSEIQKAWNKENLEMVMGGEAHLAVNNDSGEPKRDEDGDLVHKEKEYILAANQGREFYTFIGDAEKGAGSSGFCIGVAGEKLKVPNNQDTPQSIPYPDKIDQDIVEKQEEQTFNELHIPSYVMAQGHAQDSNLTYTVFLTLIPNEEGKNFIVYTSNGDESRARMGGSAASVQPFGQKLAEQYRSNQKQGSQQQASLD